jgi:hypothetical protein
MGRRQGARSGAYLNRYVTDEQRSRRPIFIATLRAVASWLFFRVAHSLRINSDMLVFSASAARTALKNSQLTEGESHVIYGTGPLSPIRLFLVTQATLNKTHSLKKLRANKALPDVLYSDRIEPPTTPKSVKAPYEH